MDLSSRSERLMGTTITVSICHPQANELLARCFELLRSYEHRFSANDASSELMEVNHQAGIAPVQVHPDLFELIALGTLHSQAQDSHLNIAIGPLVQTWRIGFSDARRPQQGEIDQALAKIDPHQIQLDPENHTVFLMRPGMKIDLGALAKGYSADCIATFLKSQGVTDALIDLGGNILTVGQHPIKQQPWRIGIQNPVEKRGQDVYKRQGKNTSDSSTVNPFETFPHLSGLKGRHKRHDNQKGFYSFTQKNQHGIKSVVRSCRIDRRKVLDQGL